MLSDQEFIQEINRLKKERDAIILVHNYQRAEVQEIADFIGDSFGLSQVAAKTNARTIVFCGVRFMAESAAILSPQKTILLPEEDADCPLADTINVDDLRALKAKHPNATVICYVNTSAQIKAESDICCTSANAVSIVNSLNGAKEIIFIPDYNLGHYVSKNTPRECILWPGNCPTHHRLTKEEILECKAKYPQAEVLTHPECVAEILEVSDHILGTGGMLKHAQRSPVKQFIIATEMGLVDRLERENPDKVFIIPSKKLICPNMKLTTLESVYESLLHNQHIITVPAEIREKANIPLSRMLQIAP